MMRAQIFAARCAKELLRDPLSWIFCLAFPLAMLGIMSLLHASLPVGAPTIFRPDYLAPGIAVFSLCFVMLFAALMLSKDRSSALLTRLFISPMRAADFLLGYVMPLGAIAIGQITVTYLASMVIGSLADTSLSAADMLLSMIALMPAVVLFIAAGLLFGALLSDKAAPGIASIFISAASMLGGVWMDVDGIGGVLADICRALPFYHAVRLGRAPIIGTDARDTLISLAVVCIYTAAIVILAILAFRRRMRAK